MYTICFSHFPWISQLLAHISNDMFLYFSPYFTWISHCLFLRIFRGFPIVFAYVPWIFPSFSDVSQGFSMDFPYFSDVSQGFAMEFLWISHGFPPFQACPQDLEELRGCNESPCGGKHCEAAKWRSSACYHRGIMGIIIMAIIMTMG